MTSDLHCTRLRTLRSSAPGNASLWTEGRNIAILHEGFRCRVHPDDCICCQRIGDQSFHQEVQYGQNLALEVHCEVRRVR